MHVILFVSSYFIISDTKAIIKCANENNFPPNLPRLSLWQLTEIISSSQIRSDSRFNAAINNARSAGASGWEGV